MGLKIKATAVFLCVLCLQLLQLNNLFAVQNAQGEKKSQSAYVIAYYFHGTFRCSSCKKIEQYSREAIEKYFSKQLQSKRLMFQPVNVDLPENRHFIKDYKLFTRSLIVARFKGGKQIAWKNLNKVWQYLNDRETFYKYVQSGVQNALDGIK